MVAYDPGEWSDLFVAAAGASAALTGLVFVAVSINLERILALPGTPERALGTLGMLLGVAIVSIIGLIRIWARPPSASCCWLRAWSGSPSWCRSS